MAPYQVLCLVIRDPELHAALTTTETIAAGSGVVRGARLAAVQAGVMRAAVEERGRRVLSFHSRVVEAEAMAAAMPAVAGRLAADAPGTFPPAEWPELREWRPPRLVSDRTAARLRVGHALW